MTLEDQFRSLRDAGRLDAAWCVAAALVATRRASPDVITFHAASNPRGLQKITGTVPWMELAHPIEQGALRTPALIADRTHAAAGVRKKDRRDPSSDPLLISKMITYVAGVLDVRIPELYLLEDRGAAIEAVLLRDGDTRVQALVCRPSGFNGLNEREVAYRIAIELARFRAEGIPRTARRVAAVICGDIAAARADQSTDSDLVDFWTSEPHFAVRQRLGLAIAKDSGVPVASVQPTTSSPSRSLAEQFAEHKAAKRFDEAWCIANALVATGAASPEIDAYAERFAGRTRPSGVLSWREIQHPDEDVTLSLQLAKSWATRAAPYAQTLAQAKLSEKKRIKTPTHDPVLDMKYPAYFEVKTAPRPAQRVILVDGGEPYPAMLMRLPTDAETPLATFWSIEELALTRLPYRLCGVVTDLPVRWVNAVRATARRAALIFTGDLKVALQATPPEAHADLVAFFTSDVYFQIRKDLAMTIAHRLPPEPTPQ
jgi:hypothetical protein